MKVECLKWDFCDSKAGKKWKREELRVKNPVLELKEMEIIFLNEIVWLYYFFFLFIFFFYFKWFLMLTMLSSKSCF